MECGPNSKTKERSLSLESKNGVFSKTFYYTGTKLLIHKDNRNYIYSNDFPFVDRSDAISSLSSNQENFPQINKIGVIGGSRKSISDSSECPIELDNLTISGTTTGENIPFIYGAPTKVLALRSQAVSCLLDKKIIAYASDEILLIGMLKENGEKLANYVIEPRTSPLTYEEYGIVLYGSGDSREKLKRQVDKWLEEDSAEVLEKVWSEQKYTNYSYAVDANIPVRILWRPLESLYRQSIPLKLMQLGIVRVILAASLSLLMGVLFLTHRWIATPIVRVFPFLFTIPISGIRHLRRRGMDKNNWLLLFLAESMRGVEETLVDILQKSGGRKASQVSEYDVLQLLKIQLHISERLNYLERKKGLDSSDANESVAEGIAEQMKYNPHARKVFEEAIQSGAQSFGSGIGSESANQVVRLLSRIEELINNDNER